MYSERRRNRNELYIFKCKNKSTENICKYSVTCLNVLFVFIFFWFCFFFLVEWTLKYFVTRTTGASSNSATSKIDESRSLNSLSAASFSFEIRGWTWCIAPIFEHKEIVYYVAYDWLFVSDTKPASFQKSLIWNWTGTFSLYKQRKHWKPWWLWEVFHLPWTSCSIEFLPKGGREFMKYLK